MTGNGEQVLLLRRTTRNLLETRSLTLKSYGEQLISMFTFSWAQTSEGKEPAAAKEEITSGASSPPCFAVPDSLASSLSLYRPLSPSLSWLARVFQVVGTSLSTKRHSPCRISHTTLQYTPAAALGCSRAATCVHLVFMICCSRHGLLNLRVWRMSTASQLQHRRGVVARLDSGLGRLLFCCQGLLLRRAAVFSPWRVLVPR